MRLRTFLSRFLPPRLGFRGFRDAVGLTASFAVIGAMKFDRK